MKSSFLLHFRNNTNVTGQYLVIKYKLTNNGNNMTVSAPFASSAANGRNTAAGRDGDDKVTVIGGNTLYADGEWHYLIITPDLVNNKTFTANADGSYSWKYLRIRLNGWAATDSTCYIDIDEIAFADDIYIAERYAKGDAAVCSHAKNTIVWDDENGYTITCQLCGKVTEDDMIYKTEANTGNLGYYPESDFMTASKEDGFVRYTIKAKPSDGYFLPFTGNTSNVTGQYMVIKYKLTNNGKNLTVTAPYASSAASGQGGAAGKNGDNSNSFVNGDTLYADGEWHYLVITPNEGNATFVKNHDGTYTWTYLRITINNFDAYDGSCHFDIDEIAFADNMEAVNAYIAK